MALNRLLLLVLLRRRRRLMMAVLPVRPLVPRRPVLVLDPVPAVVAARRPMAVLVRVPSVSPAAPAVGGGVLVVLPTAVLLALADLVEQVADGDELKAAEEDHICGLGRCSCGCSGVRWGLNGVAGGQAAVDVMV
jgi:hypothetical protein